MIYLLSILQVNQQADRPVASESATPVLSDVNAEGIALHVGVDVDDHIGGGEVRDDDDNGEMIPKDVLAIHRAKRSLGAPDPLSLVRFCDGRKLLPKKVVVNDENSVLFLVSVFNQTRSPI